MSNRAKMTPEKRETFLTTLETTGGQITKACKACAVSRDVIYRLRKSDEQFGKDFEAALDKGIDLLEAECKRRAFEGVPKPVFYKGKECGIIQEYSDTLAIFLMKAHRSKYKEKFLLTGEGGGAVKVLVEYVNKPNGVYREVC